MPESSDLLIFRGARLQLVEFIIAGSGCIFSAIIYAEWYMSVEKAKTYGTDPGQIPMAYISHLPFFSLDGHSLPHIYQ